MKTGDDVYCIKEYNKYPPHCIEKGKLYKIEKIIDFYNSDNKHKIGININCMHFTLKKEPQLTYHLRFYDHFITIKELRKQKLLKINQTR